MDYYDAYGVGSHPQFLVIKLAQLSLLAKTHKLRRFRLSSTSSTAVRN